MSSGRDPAADRAYLAAVLHAELDGGATVQQITERWGISREMVGRLLDEAERAEAGDLRQPGAGQPHGLLEWFLRAVA